MSKSVIGCALFACVLGSPLVGGIAHAQTATVQPAEQATWPQKVTVTVGDVRTRIDGPKMWTLSGIDYKNTMMATEESAYGMVVTIRNVGHLGTAHFLDVPGQPGKVEKELVNSMKLFVDDKPVTEFKPTMDLSGQSFRMERTSKIRQIDLESTVTLRDGVLMETSHFRMTGPMDSQKAHPLMYAWTPKATAYVFGDDGGIQRRGKFIQEGKSNVESIKNCNWVAVFDPASGKGSVCYLTKQPKGEEAVFLVVDALGVYRKVALMSFIDKIMPEGFDGTYQSAIGFFEASEADWEAQALKRQGELKAFAEKQEKQ